MEERGPDVVWRGRLRVATVEGEPSEGAAAAASNVNDQSNSQEESARLIMCDDSETEVDHLQLIIRASKHLECC